MLEVLERGDRARDDLVRRPIVQPRDHPDAARVVLKARVVEADGLWRLLVVRVMEVLPGVVHPARGRTGPGGMPPGAGTRAPEAEPKA